MLKHASKDCEFSSALNPMLVDQLIAGVRSRSVANKLLEASDGFKLTFSEAMHRRYRAEGDKCFFLC